jgi:ppGpp synthetase/RelA/SpoT-type nucleotidyltranferase
VNELSRSQVEKLGRRLRHDETPSVEDLRMLEQVRRTYEVARFEVVEALRREGLKGTSRLKTTSTIIEKLGRGTGMNLSRMQDIAGVRLVIDGNRLDQDRVVERILGLFSDARVTDRRVKPSYGYRAVHVIVRVQGCLVEVQVRTHLQDMWAQAVERLADVFGRQIRYGEPPIDADAQVARGVTRQDFLRWVMLQGELTDAVETKHAALAEAEEVLEAATDADVTPATAESVLAKYEQADRRIGDLLEEFSAALKAAVEQQAADDNEL